MTLQTNSGGPLICSPNRQFGPGDKPSRSRSDTGFLDAYKQKDGSFKIENIPAGKYKLTVWHPYIGETSREVTVTADGASTADFTLSLK